MTAETILASLHLSTPELILAVGALVLLMIGVFSGEKSTGMVTGLAVGVLIVAGGLAGADSRATVRPMAAPSSADPFARS